MHRLNGEEDWSTVHVIPCDVPGRSVGGATGFPPLSWRCSCALSEAPVEGGDISVTDCCGDLRKRHPGFVEQRAGVVEACVIRQRAKRMPALLEAPIERAHVHIHQVCRFLCGTTLYRQKYAQQTFDLQCEWWRRAKFAR